MPTSADKPATVQATPMDQVAVRRANLALVLAEVRTAGPASRADVARRTGLTRPTVSSLVGELLDRGLVREADLRQDGSVGRPARRLELDGRTVAALGLEINSRYLAACSVDLAGRTIQERRLVHDATEEGADATVRALAVLTRELLDHATRSGARVAGVGIAVPGPVAVATGRVYAAPNLGWKDVPVAERLREAAGLPGETSVVVDNEANLAALAEWETAHPGVTDLMYVTGEAGLGAGIVAGGQLLQGASGFSGELGHIQIDPDGDVCACGRTGCLETKVSLPAALRTAAPDLLLAEGSGPRAPWGPQEQAAELLRRAAAGDPRTLSGLDEIGRWLGTGLSVPVNLLNPRVVVLGGYFAAVAPYLLPAAMREMRARIVAGDEALCRVTGSLLGFGAAVRGAAGVIVKEVFADPGRADSGRADSGRTDSGRTDSGRTVR
ncbi:ROK family transcriptional regulator [Streptomyces nymphaeiformis]|uniref:Putative NBD/HSP70 family sugar kinase n=1 Tax=Streptomyces nymphaeiformis TaxID=2663842 RepID=A0A7W7XFE9_9ACTN|nr:ROK family transcriptional regulator [Streptomyces nymphaeiformis]MBB4986839.1 putative NBD/HSP70 family sugar kinase [Streptomyces nymphaeiformis]